MFDFLRTVAPKDLECRVVHIAASPPDSSGHPQWNTSPSFDSLTWEHLPTELKKVRTLDTRLHVL
jgi:mediator of RNA polymerase II transcription subunit 25